MKNAILITLLALASGLLGFYLSQAGSPDIQSPQDLNFEFYDQHNQAHALNDAKGKLVIINFWASWCAPCREEIPLLINAYSQYAEQGLHIIGPAMDQAEPIAEFLKSTPVNYPVFIGEGDIFELMDRFGDTLGALPFTVLLNRDGEIVERHSGALSKAQLDAWITQYL